MLKDEGAPSIESEIARLDAQIRQLSLDLDALRRRLLGSSGRPTRAFTAPPPSMHDPAADQDATGPRATPSPRLVTSPEVRRARLASPDLGLDSQPPPSKPHSNPPPAQDDAGRSQYGGARSDRPPRPKQR
ncbi:MAG: hypothetical protein NVSMB1_09040 [Polyangiales bacterium]